MKLSDELVKMLLKTFAPSALVDICFKGYDIALKTNEEINAILMFIGTKTPTGSIKGERFARSLKKDRDEKIIKDHWELKGT